MNTPTVLTRRSALAGATLLGGCQATARTEPEATGPRVAPDGTGYFVFSAAIAPRSRDYFIQAIDELTALNATSIQILINSPGGEVPVAQEMAAYVDRLAARDVRVTTHNIGLVASAACYVFLSARQRRSVPAGTFLFHQSTVVGVMTSQALQDMAAQVQRSERALTDLLVSRTRITAAEATSFVRRTVILTANEALRDGIIDGIGPADVPKGIRSRIITSRPTAATPRSSSPAAPPSGA